MPITHAFVSEVADGGDSSLLRPSDWNAPHLGADLGVISDTDPGAIGAGMVWRRFDEFDGWQTFTRNTTNDGWEANAQLTVRATGSEDARIAARVISDSGEADGARYATGVSGNADASSVAGSTSGQAEAANIATTVSGDAEAGSTATVEDGDIGGAAVVALIATRGAVILSLMATVDGLGVHLVGTGIPTTDPEVAGEIYEDPTSHALTISQGAP